MHSLSVSMSFGGCDITGSLLNAS